ncbi:MAG: acetyl-CoA carboxylase biotin carboxylase subunit [Chloroflexi bacterium]|nr:acetyl-CoA carboxylase biotin carboxylase subunit [Chloroflexota bacterium]MCL5074785.1 acetyl-CoA carboxylase biotin carboxylase subunit [Chloroflexota bacterium]
MFRKVLVANRGEIAVRILRACAELGISTVAVYSDVDRNSLHVRYADESYPIGPALAKDSYLRADKIIEVARRCQAEAIHPGYGFLAEDATFAQSCLDAGIIFIGPPPQTILAMGDKITARRTMQAVGIQVVPGSYAELRDADEAAAEAERLGLPIVIKSAAGGGGRGMRIVRHLEDLPAAFDSAYRESIAAFGRAGLYLEKHLDGVRHIEFQLLADRYGNIVHLGERECSIQRRHQKLIEEAPSAVVDEELRQRMGEMAVGAAKAAHYESVGTVEFLLDKDKNFYFLEMNTRLQVEHPVTELATGVDIVLEQLRMAAGRKLRYAQEDIKIKGWAIECRIAAEDPYNNFLPSIGRVTAVYEPSGSGVRLDSGIYDGFEVSLYYDPLIAKLAVWGETRGQAILRMRRALREYKIIGIQTNIPFHLSVMDTASFIGGRYDTSYLDSRPPTADEAERDQQRHIAAVAAAVIAHQNRQKAFVRHHAERLGFIGWKSAARREGLRPK